jgi:short-subunit dehydrogenase
VNLVAPVLLLKEAYEVFKNQGAGVIVAINSVAGLSPNFKEAVYSASKHGLKGFIGSLQAEAYKYNIKVMEYYLGAMQTPMTAMRDGFAELMKTSEVAEVIVRDVLSTNALVPIRQEIRKFPARK